MASAGGTYWTRNLLGDGSAPIARHNLDYCGHKNDTSFLQSPSNRILNRARAALTQYQLGEKGAHIKDLRRFGRFGCLYSRLTVVEQHCCAAADHVPDPGQAPVLRYHKVHELPAQRPSNARGGGGRRRLRHLARSGGLHCGRPQYECSCESVLTGTFRGFGPLGFQAATVRRSGHPG